MRTDNLEQIQVRMQTKTQTTTYGIAVIISIFMIFLCCDDRGIEPIRSGIQGTITYTGAWPSEPAEVRLVAAKIFPPTDLSDLIIGESIPVNSASYPYIFYLKPGEYALTGVAWRAKDATWDIISVCGLYFDGTDSLSPGGITIGNDDEIISNINIGVNRTRAHKVTDTHINGTIRFSGAWPDSVTEARVIATDRFRLFPQMQLPTLLDIAFSNSIAPDVNEAEYTINAFPGTYAATAVLFFKSGQSLSLNDVMYSIQVSGLNATPYTVPENETVTGPTFDIKFLE